MKLITLLFALVLTFSAEADICKSGRSANLKYDGTAENIEKCFVNVINNQGSSLDAGSFVILDVTADDGASVVKTTTASQVPLCMVSKACADNALCECQTYGLTALALFDATGGTATAGSPFYLSESTAGYVGRINVPDAADIPAGVFYDASAASGAVEVFIKLR